MRRIKLSSRRLTAVAITMLVLVSWWFVYYNSVTATEVTAALTNGEYMPLPEALLLDHWNQFSEYRGWRVGLRKLLR